jgi:acyl-coenzyme A synthetase/AMP-(fatty) acid ligase
VEHALLSYSDVEACAVVGHRDSAGLGRGVAFIVPRAGALAPEGDPSPLEAALRAHLNSRVAAFKIPAAFRFVPELPCTPTGKVRRAALRETLSHAAPAAVR